MRQRAAPDDLEPLLARLEHDVAVTVGEQHSALLRQAADTARRLDLTADSPMEWMDKIVQDVQQVLHDTFVDTTWPACPRHPRHPLWFRSGAWWCEANDARIAELGGLAPNPQRR
jgi:hypothetical protein